MAETSILPAPVRVPILNLQAPRTYAELRRRVHETLLHGQQKIEREKVRTYWETGSYINLHVRIHDGRAEYRKRTLLKLGEDLDLDVTVLHRCAELEDKFPDLPILAGWQQSSVNGWISIKKYPWAALRWSHFRALLSIADREERYRLADEAAQKGWITEVLETRVRQINKTRRGSGDTGGGTRPADRLTPLRGRLYTYRIVKDAVKGPLFTYEADLDRVTDGDTQWYFIYQDQRPGRGMRNDKLRLRGIDCPELKKAAGRAAKRFVEEQFAKAQSVLLTTTKPDKYDRYLTDVFLKMKDGSEVFLNNLLLETGHAVRVRD